MRNNTRIKPLPELSKAHNSLPSLLHADKSSWVLCYTSLPCSRGSQTPRSNQLSAVQTVQQVDLSKNDRKTQGLGAMIDMKEQKTRTKLFKLDDSYLQEICSLHGSYGS